MEYVPGPSITTYCDQNRLPNRDRLKLFRDVCLALHHAHQKGVIHLDIKPSNVLVTEQDGKPVPKVIDFGVAKAIDQQQAGQTLFTQHGILAGTPEYMSPEQANLDARDIDASSDVYSLGVLLYELLVGALPFDPKELRKKGLAEILRIIREDDPAPLTSRLATLPTSSEIAHHRNTSLSALSRQLSGELDWITRRAMEKDRRRRYNSPAEFAKDIEHYLNNDPVIASPPVDCIESRSLFQSTVGQWPRPPQCSPPYPPEFRPVPYCISGLSRLGRKRAGKRQQLTARVPRRSRIAWKQTVKASKRSRAAWNQRPARSR